MRIYLADLGHNLLSKYSMLGRFFVTQAPLDFLEQVILSALQKRGTPVAGEQLTAVMDYLRCVALHVPFAESLASTPSWTSRYDVEAWTADHFARPLEQYRFPELRSFRTFVDPKRSATITQRLATYGEHAAGLGKFTRTLFARDLRRTLQRIQPAHLNLASANN